MKRRAFKLLLFLLAGAIINVAVAWVIAYHSTFNEIEHFVRIEDRHLAFRSQPGSEWAAKGIALYMQYVFEAKLRGLPSPLKLVDAEGANELWRAILDDPEISGYEAHGWPCLSLAWFYLGAGPENQIRNVPEVKFGVHIQGSKNLHRYTLTGHVIPLRPIWPGFAINTIFYAAVLWMIFAVPGAVRRRVRRKRGQCGGCGYSLRGTPYIDKCPECGKPIAARRVLPSG